MKKIALSLMALAMAAVSFTSCEDVPAPYDYPGKGNNGGGDTPEEGVYLNQSFASDLGDFKSIGSNANIEWKIDYSSACITGYKDYDGSGTKANQAGVTYLVSPEVDLTSATKAYVEINHAMRYERGDINTNNALLISKDYTDDPTKATWVAIPYSTDGINGTTFDFVTASANIPSDFIGSKVRLALRHTCTESQSSTWEVKTLAVKEGEVENGGSDTPDTPSTGTGEGTEASPYDVTKALAIIESGNIPTDKVYISGVISSIDEINTTNFGNATYNISVDGTTTSSQLIVYRGYYLGGEKFTAENQIKVGDKVVVYGTLKLFYEKKEVDTGSSIYSLNGQKADTGGGDNPGGDDNPDGGTVAPAGDGMTISSLQIGKASSSVDLTTNSYGTQNVNDESTWYSWNYDNIIFKGAKVCAANGDFDGCIQLQGNASDKAKQGFIFNETAYSKDIKTITIIAKGLAKYTTPTVFSVYAGTAAHPTSNAIEATTTSETGSTLNTFTMKYDFSNGSYKHFTIWNNAVGALYIEKVVIELK